MRKRRFHCHSDVRWQDVVLLCTSFNGRTAGEFERLNGHHAVAHNKRCSVHVDSLIRDAVIACAYPSPASHASQGPPPSGIPDAVSRQPYQRSMCVSSSVCSCDEANSAASLRVCHFPELLAASCFAQLGVLCFVLPRGSYSCMPALCILVNTLRGTCCSNGRGFLQRRVTAVYQAQGATWILTVRCLRARIRHSTRRTSNERSTKCFCGRVLGWFSHAYTICGPVRTGSREHDSRRLYEHNSLESTCAAHRTRLHTAP